MLEIAKDFRPHEIVVLGDFFDAYCISSFAKNPQQTFLTLEHELEEARPWLYELRNVNPKAKFVFLAGNHCSRISRYIRNCAPMLDRSTDIESILKLPKGTAYFPYGQKNRYFMGRLMATHGTIFNRHVAASMIAKYGHSCCFGHVHRAQEFNVVTVSGERLKGITFGWLGDNNKAAEYCEDINDWVHGFGLSYTFPNGEFVTQFIEIQKSGAVFDGEIY
jgi:hypothetical protein